MDYETSIYAAGCDWHKLVNLEANHFPGYLKKLHAVGYLVDITYFAICQNWDDDF